MQSKVWQGQAENIACIADFDKCNCLTHPIFKELYSEKSIEKSTHFAEYISKLADEEDTYFMNAADYAKASDIDGIHMVPEEHKKLANAFADKIKEILS